MSCASRKQPIAKTPKEALEAEKVEKTITADSNTEDVIESSKDTISKSPIISKSEKNIPIKGDSITKEFNKIITKRFIATHELWDNLLRKHVLDNGKVDYIGFKKNRIDLYNYFKVLNVSLPNKPHTRAYKLAYWINAYNAMTIDLILRHYPIKSIKDIEEPWKQRHWKLGEKWYNLNDIEHEILRKMNEPRIHFAIVCASISCPKLQNQAYNASTLEEQLTNDTKAFLNDTTKNNLSQNNLKLSKIFKWFAKDFKQDGSIVEFLNTYSEIVISDKAKKSFIDYNWDLNE